METFNIAIIDDDKSKITRIKTKFSKRQDVELDNKYSNYILNLIPIDIECGTDHIKESLMQNQYDAIIIDYNLDSYSINIANGVEIAKLIQETKDLFPLFILTAFEDTLFQREIFNAHQIYNSNNYLNNIDYRKEFHSRIIEQILASRKQKQKWEEDLKELLPHAGENVEIDSKILELDSHIENSINKECAINPLLKKTLESDKLVELLNKVDKIINEE